MSDLLPEPDFLDLIQPDRDEYIAANGSDAAIEYDQILIYLKDLFEQRKQSIADFSTYNLPQLPDGEADTIYERLQEAERLSASPRLLVDDYKKGTAKSYNDLWIKSTASPVVLTAEHATSQKRVNHISQKRELKDADFGTGGLVRLLHEDTNNSAIISTGRQTKDPNNDMEHPLKKVLGEIIKNRQQSRAHISIHGSKRTRFARLTDSKNFGVMLGIGDEPTDDTLEASERIVDIGKNYDLRVVINQDFVAMEAKPVMPKRKPYGSLKTISYSARYPGTTRAFAQRTAAGLETLRPFVAIQFELSDVLRVMPTDYEIYPGDQSQRMGTYIGYLFIKEALNTLA